MVSIFVWTEYSQLKKINDVALQFLDDNKKDVLGKPYGNVVCSKGRIEHDRGCGLW